LQWFDFVARLSDKGWPSKKMTQRPVQKQSKVITSLTWLVAAWCWPSRANSVCWHI